MHILQLFAAIVTAQTTSAPATAADLVSQLWSALLGILQHGAAAARLSVVTPD